MVLSFPSPGAFGQSVLQRRRALAPQVPLVVVEGPSDRRAILPFLNPQAVVIPARGKPNALAAYDSVSAAGVGAVLVVIDCDGDTPKALKGRDGLIISDGRDLEADLLFQLDAFHRVAIEMLAGVFESRAEIVACAEAILRRSVATASRLHYVRSAANELRVPSRIYDQAIAQRRRVLPVDIVGLPESVYGQSGLPRLHDIAVLLGVTLGWTAEQVALVSERARVSASERCAPHNSIDCQTCARSRSCNGHDLVGLLAAGVSWFGRAAVTENDVARSIRMASDRSLLDRWSLYRRARPWADRSGVALFS